MAQIMASDHQLDMRIQSEQDEIYATLRLVLADIERIQTGQLQGLGGRSATHSGAGWTGEVRIAFEGIGDRAGG